MKIHLVLFLLISFILISCSKKDVNVDLSKDGTQKNTPTNKSSQNNNKYSGFFFVNNISQETKKDRYIDFSWSENGEQKKLSDYAGKVILLNFWATWCPPCRKEIPDLSEISKELGKKDFVMIGVSVDQEPAKLDIYLKSNTIPYKIVNESGNLLTFYMYAAGNNQNVIPQTYIIDKKGNIVEKIIGGLSKQDFLKAINKYL